MTDTIGYTGTAQGGSTTTLNDNSLTQVNDFWNGYDIKILSGRNIGLIRTVSDFDATNDRLTFSVALPFPVAFGDAYSLYLSTENQIVIVGGTGMADPIQDATIVPQISAVIPEEQASGAASAFNAFNSANQLITDIVNARLNSATKEILGAFKLTQSGAINVSGTQTTLLSNAAIGDSNIEVVSVAGFPTSGVLYLQGNTSWMRITYNNVIGNRFLGIPNSGTGSITENASFTNQVLGGPGVVITPLGIVTINASGVETIVLEGTAGNVTFAGTLVGPSGTLGTITSADITGGTFKTGTTGRRSYMLPGSIEVTAANIFGANMYADDTIAYFQLFGTSGYGGTLEFRETGTYANKFLLNGYGANLVLRTSASDIEFYKGNTLLGTYTATGLNIIGELQCDTFRIDASLTTETITPDKTITISVNGVNYKIAVKAA